MPSMQEQLKLDHMIRKARKSHACARRECKRGIGIGERYMEVKEYRQTYRWCLDCFYNKLR